MSARTTRRAFLGTTAAAATTALTAGQLYATRAAARPGPNETVNIGLIGCGARGAGQVMPSFMQLPDVRMVAVCDVNSKHLAAGRERAGGNQVAAYSDYRRLLEDKSVDAVAGILGSEVSDERLRAALLKVAGPPTDPSAVPAGRVGVPATEVPLPKADAA